MSDLQALVAQAHRSPSPTLVVSGGASEQRGRVGIFPGTFDPFHVAHAALIDAALEDGCGIVVVTVPLASVDKEHLVDAASRIDALALAVEGRSGLALAVTNAGLYVDIAAAAHAAFPDARQIDLICGADKVAQILDATYYGGEAAREAAVTRLFSVATLLVAPRADIEIPDLAGIRRLEIDPSHRHVSSTALRRERDLPR